MAEAENVFFRPEELPFFDSVNAEVSRLIAPRARYFLKILPPVTQDEDRFERETVYGEQKRNWKYAGPLRLPIYMQTPDEPKEWEEGKGGNMDLSTTIYISRKLFEDSIPEELKAKIISVRGGLTPDSGDVLAMWTTHEGETAFWDVENVERDQYLGDLPLHLQWRLVLNRRSRYEPERAFGQSQLVESEPIVVLTADEFDTITKPPTRRPETPADGKITQDQLEKRALGL